MNQFVQIKSELVEIGRSNSDCAVLYIDKEDGSFWEVTYPDRSEHAGVEPTIECLSRDVAINKYKIMLWPSGGNYDANIT